MTHELIIQCEFCDHAVHCKNLNPYNCSSFLPTISSNFSQEWNERCIEPYMKELIPNSYDIILPG